MHTFACRCGSAIPVLPPSPNAGYLVWDRDVDSSIETRRKEIDAFLKASASGRRDAWLKYFYGASGAEGRLSQKSDMDVIEDILSQSDKYTRICYRCPKCGRVYIELEPGVDRYQAYTAADD
jgi:hypothetical protein